MVKTKKQLEKIIIMRTRKRLPKTTADLVIKATDFKKITKKQLQKALRTK